ncbi:MAG: IS110 family transposase [bacterium LCO1.1]|uniref:IS110 family transposase n=1 Tax=Candidatus Weimeria bifida TaxID=2599074 RepID=A0A6N7J0Q5_9FIRM|nr:IS110 family transposase [Candidatus Weimeria bifida]
MDGGSQIKEWTRCRNTRNGANGHYWFNLGAFLQSHGMRTVLVNPYHVKQAKELDDSNPMKTDRKDPKVIAGW